MTLSAVSPRRRFALLSRAAAGVLLASWCAGAAQAQDRTVVVGGPSADPVTVDLSVLDSGVGASGTYGNLLFPGSRYKPGQRVVLHPPGMVADRPVLRPPVETPPSRRALARRPVSEPSPAPVASPRPPSRPAAVARRRPPSNTPPPPPRIAMPAPQSAPQRTAKAAPPSDAALAKIKPAAGPRQASQSAKPALSAPAIKKRASVPAPTQASIPPVPPPAKRAPVSSPPSMADVPPPPDVPPVSAAPRVPVTTEPAPKSAAQPKTQVANIPRSGSATNGRESRIVFAPGSSKLEGAGKGTLQAIAKALAKDPALRVELRAYARGDDNNVSQARRLSLSRALAIRSALISEGVQATRIDVRALGNRVPSGIPNRVDLSVFTR